MRNTLAFKNINKIHSKINNTICTILAA